MRRFLYALLAPLALPTALAAQVIDLTVNNYGLAIGDKPRVNGLRINFRDRNLQEVNGVNVTIWTPYEPARGVVNGLALGLPATGADVINGAAFGLFGVGTRTSLTGIGVGLLGVGSGGPMKGIMVGGLGVGGGGDMTGLAIGGLGAGGGGNIKGVAVGILGVGGGKNFTGLGIGGLGVGTGGDVTGVTVGGLGVGAGGRIKGLAIGGLGVGAPEINGVVIGILGSGGQRVKAIALNGGYFKVEENGRFDGGALALVTNVRSPQHGLTIGLWNYARELHGAQIGLINISDNDGKRRVLPLLSVR